MLCKGTLLGMRLTMVCVVCYVVREEKYSSVLLSLQEMDCIVNQMMNVAEYLGWDVSELKPVSLLIDLCMFSTY